MTLLFALMGDDGGWFAHSDAAAAIKAALSRDERGQLVINEQSAEAAAVTPTLSEFKRQFPDFWYVVSDGRTASQYGPVPMRALAGLATERITGSFSEFVAADAPPRLARSALTVPTQEGTVLIEVGGAAYSRWQMSIGAIKDLSVVATWSLVGLFGTILPALVIVPMLIVRPVRRVATAAERIDGTREGIRLPEEGAPLELVPMISAFNRALERMDATAAEQRRFLSNAAHELRTPLARARTRIEGVSDKAVRAAIVSDMKALSSIITMLMQLARLSSAPAANSDIDLVSTARLIAAEHGPAALDCGIEIEFSALAEPVKTFGSLQAIKTALANVIHNAVQHSRQGQRIVVEVGRPATVRVIDHGPGIAAGERREVLQPFVRGHADGTGLGLAIVAQVMALHKGLVAITDTPGGGTTIVLTFPPLAEPTFGSRQGTS